MNKNLLGLRRMLALLIAVVMVLGIGFNSFAEGDDVGDGGTSKQLDPSKLVPELVLKNGGNLGVFSAGKEGIFRFELKNISNLTADKLQIELIPAKEDSKIFDESDLIRRKITLRSAQSYNAELPFKLNSALEQKNYDMTLKLTYTNLYNASFTKEIPVYFYVENNSLAPNVGITAVKTEREFVDSKSPQKLTLTVSNGGDLRAKKIVVTINGFSPKTINLANDLNSRKVDNLVKGMKQNIEFNIIANPNADKDVELEAKITYLDDINKSYEKTQPILLSTSKKAEEGDLNTIELSFTQDNYEIYGDSKSPLGLVVENRGKQSISNLELRLSVEGGLKFMSKYVDTIKEIKPGEKKTFSYLAVSADPAQEGNFPVTATLKMGNGENAKQIIQVAGVTCYKKEDEKKGGKKPKIIIADYSYNMDKIIAGKEFLLTLIFKNTSQNIGVKNAKFTFTSDDGMFIPVDSANSFFIDYINPEDTASVSIKLKTKPEAAVKMYNMTFTGEYEDMNGVSYDEKGNPYKSEELISLNVRQEARLQIPDFKLPPDAMVGIPIPLDIEFYNLGKSSLYNTVVKIVSEDFEKDPGEYFVGNFEAAKSDIFSTKLIPLKDGELKGKLVFTFEDEAGNPSEISRDFSINVMDVGEGGLPPKDDLVVPPGDLDGIGDMPELDENGNPISGGFSPIMIVGIVVVLLVIFVVLYKLIKKRKMKQLEIKLLEEDDEDK